MSNPLQKNFLAALFFVSLLLPLAVSAAKDSDKIPLDPEVRTGKLNNGMTYYIRKNTKPEKRVELRLAVNCGSVQEDDNQIGMAHFVEHMGFNGSKNFQKNDLIHYLQSIGVKFGAELNAFTSFDETVYMLTVPTDSADQLNKGFQVMEDWAHDMTFDTSEIRKERGVIVEEWRLGRGAWQRMADKFIPVMLNGTKYASRLPIGTKESIENTTNEDIVRFYKEWYRPDMMALVVVGDINPVEIEAKIKKDYEDFLPVPNARKREDYPIPDNKGTAICIVSDKETPFNGVHLVYKTEPMEGKTLDDYKKGLMYTLFTGMMNRRLQELKEQSNPPFTYCQASFDRLWVRSRHGYQVYIGVDEKGIEKGLKTILVENERVKRFGFTASEFERYKLILLKEIENDYNEKDKTESEKLAWGYVNHFLKKEPNPGAEFDFQFAKENIDKIKLKEINKIGKKWISDDNRLIIVTGIDKENVKLPTEQEIALIAKSVKDEKIVKYEEEELSSELLTSKPVPGKIVSEKLVEKVGVTELELSNGIKIRLKPTKFKNDEILIKATSPGGLSIVPDSSYFSGAIALFDYFKECGAGKFSNSELKKILSGKKVFAHPILEENFHGLKGGSSKNDFETLLQLVHLYFAYPYEDSTAFLSFVSRGKSLVQNIASDPVNYFFDQSKRILYKNHLRTPMAIPTVEDINTVKYQKFMTAYRKWFGAANNFSFTLVGSFDAATVKPLLELYLGSLPIGEKTEVKDLGMRPITGPFEQKLFKGKDPKSFVVVSLNGDADYSQVESHLFYSVGSILQRIYMDKLREDMSGVYGMNIECNISKHPYPKFSMQIVIPCSPDNVDKLVKAALEEIDRIKTAGVTDAELEKEIETQKRGRESKLKDNYHWQFALDNMMKNGDDYARLETALGLIPFVTKEAIKNIAIKYLDTSKCVKIALYPENGTK
ncbi:MAG: insulinase family protein [Fibrobacteres bacterium]|nr:insulinase family protein [Fibrobacterota bacterium]